MIFYGIVECQHSSWFSTTFTELVVSHKAANFSNSTFEQFSFSDVYGGYNGGNNSFDMTHSQSSNGWFYMFYLQFTVLFVRTDFFNRNIEEILSSTIDFTKAQIASSNTDLVNGTCCYDFSRSNGCQCDINIDKPSVQFLHSDPIRENVSPTIHPLSPSGQDDETPMNNDAEPQPSNIMKPEEKDIEVGCFLEHATVRLISGQTIAMRELRHGHSVALGNGMFSDVIFFGHRLRQQFSEYIEIWYSGNWSLVISPRHYVYVNHSLTAAKNVRPGDWLMHENGIGMNFIQ